MTLRRDTSGLVFIEFIFVVGPMLLLILGVAQIVLLQAAQLSAIRAGNAATRAAIVVLDDDPRFYGGEPRNQAPPGSQRWLAIHQAAAQVLVSAQPPNRTPSPSASLFDAMASPATSTDLPLLLTPSASLLERTTVGLDAHRYGPGDPVTVKVSFRYRCMVPLARRFVCPGGERLLEAEATLPNQAAGYDY